ncbi:MAG: hypothetical protein LBG46_00335 [Elusimicrobiota bacterium]|jgi:uncharacterized small protein (DUF1192 family)|nr:hypothetical protein [Elusimicrobiota bacterium]
MKNIFVLFFLASFCGCISMGGNYSYIPIGPQNLSVQITNAKDMPVFAMREDIQRPWASLGLMRVKNLPNDKSVINNEIEKVKAEAAKKGAQAVIINQYFDDNSPNSNPVIVAAYLVRYLDDVSAEDKQKIDEFLASTVIENGQR